MQVSPEEIRRLAEAALKNLVGERNVNWLGLDISYEGLADALTAVWPTVFAPDPNAVVVRIAVAINDGDMVGTFSAMSPVWTDDKLMREAVRDYRSNRVTHQAMVEVPIPPVTIPTVQASSVEAV